MVDKTEGDDTNTEGHFDLPGGACTGCLQRPLVAPVGIAWW